MIFDLGRGMGIAVSGFSAAEVESLLRLVMMKYEVDGTPLERPKSGCVEKTRLWRGKLRNEI